MEFRERTRSYSQHSIRGKGKINYQKSIPQAKVRNALVSASYFSLESFFLLVCLATSLLVLPLILPPLPPPPLLLLLLAIGILGLLVVLAFKPTNVRDLTYTYV